MSKTINSVTILPPTRSPQPLRSYSWAVRLECCECHNHPFNSMKQTDFWGVAAFFSDTHSQNASQKDLKADVVPGIHDGGAVKKKKDAPTTVRSVWLDCHSGHERQKRSRQNIWMEEKRRSPITPVFERCSLPGLTSSQNKYFAPAAVNKTWANFFGRGLLKPGRTT